MSLAQRQKQLLINIGIAVVFCVLLAWVVHQFVKNRANYGAPLRSNKSPQHAATPLGYPVTIDGKTTLPPLDHRFIQLSGFERASLPHISHMTQPMGTEHGALTYNAQAYWDMNKKRGGHHTGDDINGIGGMNTDLGDPIYSMSTGLVVYRGEPSPGWGNTVLVAYRGKSGRIQMAMYAHMDQIYVTNQELVAIGSVLGTVGTANQNYIAHLHLEVHDASWLGVSPRYPGYTNSPGHCLDPKKVLAQHVSNQTPDRLHRSYLAIMQENEIAAGRSQQIIRHSK